jgi:hypothetical protein
VFQCNIKIAREKKKAKGANIFVLNLFWICVDRSRKKCIWLFMDPSSNLLRKSMRECGILFHSTFHATPKLRAWGSIRFRAKQFFFLTSNFWHWKLEVEQSNILQVIKKQRAQKLVDFKISNSSFYCYLIPIISLCCKAL